MYKVSLRKYRSTWNWFTENPQGGGFGSNYCGPKRIALHDAIRFIPAGERVEIVTYNENRFVSRVEIVKSA